MIQLLRFIALTFMTAPPNYIWQQFLERTFPAYPPTPQKPRIGSDVEKGLDGGKDEGSSAGAAEPKFSLRNTLTKWFVDCMTAGAIMNTIAFLILMGILKGQATAQIWNNIMTV